MLRADSAKQGKHTAPLLSFFVTLENDTLMLFYHCHKPVFRPKMAIFRRVGMREGGLPLPLAF